MGATHCAEDPLRRLERLAKVAAPQKTMCRITPCCLLSVLLLCCAPAFALENFPPVGMAATDHELVIPIEVQSVVSSPASITFKIHKTTYALDVYRKNPDSIVWGNVRATIPAGTTTWTDSTVVAGTLYEYRFHAQGVPAVTDIDGFSTSNNLYARTHLLAGVDVDRTGERGRVVLVMPTSIQTPLAPEIDRFKRDLAGDGWIVHDVLTPDGRNDWTDSQDGYHVQVRADISAIYNTYPSEVKNVIILGRVPQPRSGLRVAWAPDGHGDLGAVAADCYYADVNNTWTDTGTISVAYANEAGSVRSPWFNNPGDGRFDQSHFRSLTEAFEMGWGRIDFRGSVNGGYEIGALRDYLNKVHDYKHAQNGFKPGRRSLMIDGGSLFKHVQEEFWKNITQLSGLANVDYITGTSLPSVAWQPEAQYTAENGPYLYSFTAGNEPNKNSNMARAVFWTGTKSHMAYWDFSSWMRERIAEPDSWALSWTSIPARGRYVYHKMALGGTIGDMMRATINNQDNETGLYGSAVRNYINGAWTVQNPSTAPQDYSGFTFMGHMGDPTLRDQMIESPAWVRGRLQSAGAQVAIEWLASPDATHGYDVYSAPAAYGPFTMRTSSPVHVNATTGERSWTDTSPPSDPVFYMVRVRKLEHTPSGSFFNASVGRITEVDRTPATFAIATTVLPTAYLSSVYNFQLATTGGNPPAAWSIISGSLPTGITVSASGLISGTPTNAGSYPITVRTVDLQGAAVTRALTLTVDMFYTWSPVTNGTMNAAPSASGSFNQTTINTWYYVAAPNTQWDYDSTNKWASTDTFNRTGAQPGIGYVIPDNKAKTGAVAFRFSVKNTDGNGTPNRLDYRVYGINGTFSWDFWNFGSNPTGTATLLHISSVAGSFDWTTFETPALPVAAGYDYYVIRYMPSNVLSSEGDFMGLDNLAWSTAQPPPVFYDVAFSAGPKGSLTGTLTQTVVGSGSTSPVTAVPANGYELANWTWTGGGTSTANPLTIPSISANLSVTANFHVFNNPPSSFITLPANNATYPQGYAVPFTGMGIDAEDGTIASATWTSSINGAFTLTGGTHALLSPGTHTITRTITDSGGKTASATRTLTILADTVLAAVADAFVRSDVTNADSNFGTNTTLRVRATEGSNSYLRFDLASLSAPIGLAKLRLTTANSNTGNVSVISVADDAWGESTITFNNRPASSGVLGSLAINEAVTATGYEIDVTDYINAQIAGNKLASLHISPGAGFILFHSKEASTASRRPQLRINVAPQQDLFATWTAGLMGDSALPDTDLLGDGMSNLLRYALGGTPTTPASVLRPGVAVASVESSPRLSISFDRVADSALIYQVWASTDLVDWGITPVWSSTGGQNNAGEVVVIDPIPLSDNPRRFLRLEVMRE